MVPARAYMRIVRSLSVSGSIFAVSFSAGNEMSQRYAQRLERDYYRIRSCLPSGPSPSTSESAKILLHAHVATGNTWKYHPSVDGGRLLNACNTLSPDWSPPLLCSDLSTGNDRAFVFFVIVVHDRKPNDLRYDGEIQRSASPARADGVQKRVCSWWTFSSLANPSPATATTFHLHSTHRL